MKRYNRDIDSKLSPKISELKTHKKQVSFMNLNGDASSKSGGKEVIDGFAAISFS